MYVIPKLRLNKFVAAPIVTARQMFLAKGECPALEQSKETVACYNQPTLLGAKKTQLIHLGQLMTASAYAKHVSAGASPSLNPTNPRDL